MGFLDQIQQSIPVVKLWVIKGNEDRDVSQLEATVFPAMRGFRSGRLKAGEVGLLITHFSLLEEIKTQEGYHIIFESDCGINGDLSMLKDFPNTQIAFLDFQTLEEFLRKKAKLTRLRGNWVTPVNPLRTHAMLVHSNAAGELLKKASFIRALDWFYKDCRIPYCGLRPTPFYFKDYPSTVQ